MDLTAEQILALAPDTSSAKAGSQHADPGKWSGLGAQERALWGLCQGSGKDPYRTQIDTNEPAFKCTCPSRKFPCKHALGLYLLYAKNVQAFTDAAIPAWVSDWLQSRDQRSEKKASNQANPEKPQSAEELAAKALSQQKRQEKRIGNVLQGIDLLERWLADLAREGLAGLKSKPADIWDAMASRMVDMQATGLAVRIRRAGALVHKASAANREVEVARELGLLALLAKSYRNIEYFAPPLQFDIRTSIGWVTPQEEVFAQAGVKDVWQVLGNLTEHEERLSRRASYLLGQESGRWAMLLQYSAGSQALPPPLLPGTSQHGTLHFYSSATPLRALAGDDMQLAGTQPASRDKLAGHAVMNAALADYAQALAANPFIEQYPMLLHAVTPRYAAHDLPMWCLCDSEGRAVPIHAGFQQGWHLHSLAGGAPVSVFGLWDGYAYLPLTVLLRERIYSFDRGALA